MHRQVAAGILFVTVAACVVAQGKAASSPEIRKPTDPGDFVDLDLAIDRIENGRYIVKAQYKGKPIGFAVELGSKWQPLRGAGIPLIGGTIAFRSTGPESDHFVRTLAELYGIENAKGRMVSEIRFTAIALEGSPNTIKSRPLRMKLFFEGSNKREYAEVYGNFEVSKGVFEFHEKDPEYRQPLVRALTGDSR